MMSAGAGAPRPAGIELKHVHRHRDGTEASNSNYGGRTAARGAPHRQEVPDGARDYGLRQRHRMGRCRASPAVPAAGTCDV
jgi:hypothetical protein